MSDFKLTPPPTSNQILARLPPEEYARLSPHLEAVALSVGDVLYYPQDPVTHVYFPNRGSVSIISTFADSKITAPSNTTAATSPSSTAKNWNHIRASVTGL